MAREPETARIGRLEPEQARDCARLHAASFVAPWSPDEFEAFLAAGQVIAHGIFDPEDARLVAFVLSRVACDEAEILTLAVDPAFRRRGLASRLLAAHARELAEAGVGSLLLEVDAQNEPARALYAAARFTVVGERKDYYRAARARPSSALVLRRDLDRAEGSERPRSGT